jgi:hypothetical protein
MKGVIRFATEKEREAIAAQADLGPTSAVLAWDPPAGGEPVLLVARQIVELDPWYFNGASPRNMWMAELAAMNYFKGSGVSEYYFRVPVEDKEFQEVLEHMGAENTSKGPEFRYRRRL